MMRILDSLLFALFIRLLSTLLGVGILQRFDPGASFVYSPFQLAVVIDLDLVLLPSWRPHVIEHIPGGCD